MIHNFPFVEAHSNDQNALSGMVGGLRIGMGSCLLHVILPIRVNPPPTSHDETISIVCSLRGEMMLRFDLKVLVALALAGGDKIDLPFPGLLSLPGSGMALRSLYFQNTVNCLFLIVWFQSCLGKGTLQGLLLSVLWLPPIIRVNIMLGVLVIITAFRFVFV